MTDTLTVPFPAYGYQPRRKAEQPEEPVWLTAEHSRFAEGVEDHPFQPRLFCNFAFKAA